MLTTLQEAAPPFIPAEAHAMTAVIESPPGDPDTAPHRQCRAANEVGPLSCCVDVSEPFFHVRRPASGCRCQRGLGKVGWSATGLDGLTGAV